MFGFGERAKMKGPAVVCDLTVLLALPHEPLARGLWQHPGPRTGWMCGMGLCWQVSLPLLFPLMSLHKVFYNFLKKQKHNPSA